jgi:predicted PurR-regulated permease PerM
MAKRKQYIIDKKFQLKTTFKIIGSIFVVVALLTVLIVYNIINVNKEIKSLNENIKDTNLEIANIMEIEDDIVQVLSVPIPNLNTQNQKMNLKMAQHHDTNMKKVKNRINKNEKFIEILKSRLNVNLILLFSVIGILIIQGIVFFYMLIRQTHRIAGPIYVISQYMNQIINGEIPKKIRKLRDKDYLNDFYSLFEEMLKNISIKK